MKMINDNNSSITSSSRLSADPARNDKKSSLRYRANDIPEWKFALLIGFQVGSSTTNVFLFLQAIKTNFYSKQWFVLVEY